MAEAPHTMTHRFGVFEANLQARELRKHGVRVRLRGQPFAILAMLLERPGEVVTREEMRKRLWSNGSDETFVDFEHSMNSAIKKLRAALNDSPENSMYVETIPKLGYRFIAPVEKITAEARKSREQDGHTTETLAGISWSTRLAIFVPALALTLGLVLWRVLAVAHRASADAPVRSIAVLPLVNLSGDPSQEFFADGMTDELITDLAKVGSLRVISRTSVMRYKGTKKGLPEIARELNVDGIVEGSVVRSGQHVRITAQLLHGPTDKHLWAESYERDLGDVLRLQSDVAQAIAGQVRAELTPQLQARLRSARPINPEAYEPYLRGRYYLSNQFTMTSALNAAKSNFEESIRKDPSFALAYSGLADSYVYLAFFGELPPELAYKSAKDAVNKALQLDDSIGEAYDTLGLLSWRFDWDWDAAERNFNKAIALAPSYSCAHEDRAVYLSFLGRRAEGLAEIAKSNAIDPGPSSAMAESASHYEMRDFEALLDEGRRLVLSDPKEWTGHANLAAGYEGTGKLLEATFEYQKAVELSDGNPDAAAWLAHAYASIGKRAQAQRILRDLEQKSKSSYVSPYTLATIYANLGDKDKAFELLERAYRERALDITFHIKADLRIDSLRSDPRFQDLLRRIGYPAS